MGKNVVDHHNKASLYIVRSPLQLLNCYEASRQYGDECHKVLLVVYRQDFDRDLMLKLVEEDFWDEIHLADFRSNLTQFSLISRLLRRMPRIEFCFLGDYTHSINILINSKKPRCVIWVDDGVATLQCAKLIATGEFFSLTKHYKKKSKLAGILETLTRGDCNYLRNVEFFTIYDHIRGYSPTLNVRANDYRFLRERIASLPSREIVYFIGNDLRRYVLKDPDRFEAYIAAVSRHYAGREWRYVLHRKEDMEFMRGLAQKFGFTLEKFDRILEQQFLSQGWYPAEIATFCSSALDTLNILYRPRLVAFPLSLDDVRPDREIVIRELYRYYTDLNVTLVTGI